MSRYNLLEGGLRDIVIRKKKVRDPFLSGREEEVEC